ncbi:glutamate receptor ionotropic, kainate 2-like [Panulirus ornatus]|uniref:glutamate receptor ionotropic, kainate 2-like n=1 Tax=Panulirus ornatus TaxID=150431 RepID=UPI003A8A323C
MRRCSTFVLLLLAAVASGRADRTAVTVTEGAHQVAVVVGQVVEQYLAECHLVLAATTQYSPLLQHINRQLSNAMGSVVVDAASLFDQEQPTQDHLLHGLWGEARHTCRALILHLNHGDDSLAFRFFETSELWLWPDTSVVIVGERPGMKAFLRHPSLHNVKDMLYFVVQLYERLTPKTMLKTETTKKAWSERVKVYQRCLYCDNGGVDVRLDRVWNLTSLEPYIDDLFIKQPEDFMGHKFEILGLPFYPHSNYKRNSEEPGTTVTLLDSVDARMINSFSSHANFSYEVREPLDRQWGVDTADGNWTGTIGMLQHQLADFGFDLDLTPKRKEVVEYSVLHTQEYFVIFSLKPGLLPQQLAIIRPFMGAIWLLLFISFLVWSTTLWLVQKSWSVMAGEHIMDLSYTFLYGWSVLMEEFSINPAVSSTSQFLVGLWLMTCLIITNIYRCSLAAHLIVQDKMPAIDTFQDLLIRDGWEWGSSFTNDATMLFFKYHPDPDIQKLHEGMQYALAEEQFRRVLKGGYSHLTYKNLGMAIVGASITDNRGYTPIYVSKTEYLLFLGLAWGFRRGAPFRHRISMMMQHMVDAGLIAYWIEDVLADHMRNAREEREKGGQEEVNQYEIFEVADRNVTFGLGHLQGAFYLLLLGFALALLSFGGETFANYNSSSDKSLMIVENPAPRKS